MHPSSKQSLMNIKVLEFRWRITQKYWKGKGKLLPKIEEISGGKAHTESHLKYFDGHRCLSLSEESKFMCTHCKDGVTREFLKGATRGFRERKVGGGRGGMENS